MMLEKDYELMLSKLAHELRNPLTTLSSTLQLIEIKHPEAKQFPHWSSLALDLEFITQLINDFSNLSASDSLNISTFEIRPFMEQMIHSFTAYMAGAKLIYTCDVEPSFHQITGDKIKLQEVFSNLLKNAFEAAPDGFVVVNVSSASGHIIITIKDNGCGIPKEHLDSIFEPFITYKKNGTGLGLSIVKNIVDAHHGTIQVESAPDIGTTFRVTLPANQKCHEKSCK